jgi:hypothetical protein
MNNLIKMVSIIGLTAIAQTGFTAEVTDTYNSGDTLTAATLETIRDAVNDNDTRISEIVLTPGPTGADGSQGLAGADGSNAAGPYIETRAPTSGDDINDSNAYAIGSIWVDTNGSAVYIMIDNTPGSAIWTRLAINNVTHNIVFVTSAIYTRDLGGLDGADSNCRTRAITQGLSGTFKAWLSGIEGSAASRLVQSELPYVRTDGVVIADNWTDLTDGSLANTIDISAGSFWSCTMSDGSTKAGCDAMDWSSDSLTSGYSAGNTQKLDYWWSQWTNAGGGTTSDPRSLLCIQQNP